MIVKVVLLFLLCVTVILGQTNDKGSKMETNKITSIVAFGDGLTDMGRFGKLTNFRYPPSPPFYEGRWTNGPVWIEHFAKELGIKISFDNNFAMGGATTGFFNINEPLRNALQIDSSIQIPGMLKQVELYLEQNPVIENSKLVVLWAGGHDIGNYLEYGFPDIVAETPIQNYKKAVELLLAHGATKFMVGTMPDMGYTPMYYGTEKQSVASKHCVDLNNGLKDMVEEYSRKNVDFYVIDAATLFSNIAVNPSNYGIKVVNEAYLPFDVINFADPLNSPRINYDRQGESPNEYMSWWAVSASAKVHQLIATEALSLIKK